MNLNICKSTTSHMVGVSGTSKASSFKSDVKWKFSKINRTNSQEHIVQISYTDTDGEDYGEDSFKQIKCTSAQVPVRYHHSSLVVDGSLYVYGGYQVQSGILDDFLVYKTGQTPNQGKWETLSSLDNSKNIIDDIVYPGPRHSHSAIEYKSKIIIFGGKTDMLKSTNQIHAYSLETKKWELIASKNPQNGPENIDSHKAIVYGDQMLIFGGFQANQYSNKMYSLNLETFQWSVLFSGPNKLQNQQEISYPEPRADFSMTRKDNKIYIYAGHCSNRTFNDLWEFDLIDKTVKKLLNGTARSGHSSVIYQDKLVIYGGINGVTHQRDDLISYNLTENKWVTHWRNSQQIYQQQHKKQQQNNQLSKDRLSMIKTKPIDKHQHQIEASKQKQQMIVKKYRRTLKQQKQQNQRYWGNAKKSQRKVCNRNNVLLSQLSSTQTSFCRANKPDTKNISSPKINNSSTVEYSPLMQSLNNSIIMTNTVTVNNNKQNNTKQALRKQNEKSLHKSNNMMGIKCQQCPNNDIKSKMHGNRISARDGHSGHLLLFPMLQVNANWLKTEAEVNKKTEKKTQKTFLGMPKDNPYPTNIVSQQNRKPKEQETKQQNNKQKINNNYYMLIFGGNRHMISYNDLTFVRMDTLLK